MDTTDYQDWIAGVRVRAKAAREALGLSLRAAEEKTGVPFMSIRRVETSDFVPTLDVLWRLAVGYGVSVNELLLEPRSVPRAR
jgi:transcriptional regulator with XRE-family HTH domain